MPTLTIPGVTKYKNVIGKAADQPQCGQSTFVSKNCMQTYAKDELTERHRATTDTGIITHNCHKNA